jgi:hypothetical protein
MGGDNIISRGVEQTGIEVDRGKCYNFCVQAGIYPFQNSIIFIVSWLPVQPLLPTNPLGGVVGNNCMARHLQKRE